MRKLLREKALSMAFFEEVPAEVSSEGKRIILRGNPVTQKCERQRRASQWEKGRAKIAAPHRTAHLEGREVRSSENATVRDTGEKPAQWRYLAQVVKDQMRRALTEARDFGDS